MAVQSLSGLSTDPVSRQAGILQRLYEGRPWYESADVLRYAAVAAAAAPADSGQVGAAIRTTSDRLKKFASPLALAQAPFRYLMAAGLVLTGEDVGAFADRVADLRRLCRDRGLPHRGHQITLTALILALGGRGIESSDTALGRIHGFYQEVKRSHRWLAGAWDLPLGALYARHREPVANLAGAGLDAYRILRKLAPVSGGRSLLTASGMLPLSGRSADVTAMRFRDLFRGFRNRRVAIWPTDHADLALLALLDAPADVLVHRVLEYRRRLSRLRPPTGCIVGFHLAASLVVQERALHAEAHASGPPAVLMRAALFVPLAILATAGR